MSMFNNNKIKIRKDGQEYHLKKFLYLPEQIEGKIIEENDQKGRKTRVSNSTDPRRGERATNNLQYQLLQESLRT